MARSRLRRRLVLAEEARTCAATLAPAGPDPGAGEAPELAAELVTAFGRLVEGYREALQLSPAESTDRAAGDTARRLDRIRQVPPSRVSWLDLDVLARHDPAEARDRWEAVKRAARDEIRSGHRTARLLEGVESDCWQRARFLAVRAELVGAWQPRDGLELQLLDQMALFQALLWQWQETATALAALGASCTRRERRARPYEPPRVSDAAALQQAAGMVEQCQRLYLRALRALHDLRRGRPVVVHRARQVNVGAQQVNLG
jgi:hypothetical protein